MRTAVLLVVSLLLIAAPVEGQTDAPEEAVLTMSIGDSLVAIDSLVRTDDRLVSRVTNLHRARFLLEADLRDDASLDRLHMVIWPWDRTTEDEPAVDIVVRPVGGILMRESGDDLVAHRQIEFGTFPYVSPSLAFLEQEILHARHKTGEADSATIPMWTPFGGEGEGRTWTDTVAFTAPGSVRITGWEDTVSTYEIDADGRIVSGRIEPTGYVIERVTEAPEGGRLEPGQTGPTEEP